MEAKFLPNKARCASVMSGDCTAAAIAVSTDEDDVVEEEEEEEVEEVEEVDRSSAMMASTNAPMTEGTLMPFRLNRIFSSSDSDDLSTPDRLKAMPWFKNHENRAPMAVAYWTRWGLRTRYEAAWVMR